MSEAVTVQRDPVPSNPGRIADPAKPDTPREGEQPKAERDPLLDLVQRLQAAGGVLGDRDVGLVRAINRIAQQATEPGRAEQPLFRTHVAYALQDMEKLVGAGSTAMPPQLRAEMTRLAATSPGLENRQMEALVQGTPDIADRGLVRDVRRAAAIIAGMGAEQSTPEVREQVEALANRMRLAARPAISSGVDADLAGRLPPERPLPLMSDPRPAAAETQATDRGQGQPPAGAASTGEKVRAIPSPGGGEQPAPERAYGQERAQAAVAGSAMPEGRQRSRNAMASILDRMRAPGSDAPPPWDAPSFGMAGRISRFEKLLADGRTDQLVRASEKSGQALVQALETFMAGPGQGVLAKIEAAASTEAGGMRTVMSGMQPGGTYAALRSEFDSALQQDRVFAAAYSQVEKTGAQYGKDRLALGADFSARKLDAAQLDARFGQADATVGEATARIPGRTPGRTVMDELGEKLSEVFHRAVERVKQVLGRDAEAGPRASSSPGMRP